MKNIFVVLGELEIAVKKQSECIRELENFLTDYFRLEIAVTVVAGDGICIDSVGGFGGLVPINRSVLLEYLSIKRREDAVQLMRSRMV